MNKIGIDFGTSFCTASWINPTTKQPEAITFHEIGIPKMPSVVYYSPDGAVVGLAAYNMLENSVGMKEEPRRLIISSVVTSIKRNMQQGQYFYLNGSGKVSHEEIIAEILKKIRIEAQITCFNNQLVEGATITHPVVFAAWQKEMLRKAATIAGFKEVKLLEEPVAAALGYSGINNDKAKGILVYDFGGGTFDVAYVQRDDEGNFRVPLAPEGEPNCGGDDIDRVIYELWEKNVKQQLNRSINSNPDTIDIGFMTRCRKNKQDMTLMPSNSFVEVLPPPGLQRAEMKLDRQEYNKLIEPIVDKTIAKTIRLLGKINESGYAIDAAIMIGGSSRIPLVYEKLKEILPVEPRKVMSVDVAVAIGAIMHDRVKEMPRTSKTKVFCIHCGKQILSDDRFCIYCGKKNESFTTK